MHQRLERSGGRARAAGQSSAHSSWPHAKSKHSRETPASKDSNLALARSRNLAASAVNRYFVGWRDGGCQRTRFLETVQSALCSGTKLRLPNDSLRERREANADTKRAKESLPPSLLLSLLSDSLTRCSSLPPPLPPQSINHDRPTERPATAGPG